MLVNKEIMFGGWNVTKKYCKIWLLYKERKIIELCDLFKNWAGVHVGLIHCLSIPKSETYIYIKYIVTDEVILHELFKQFELRNYTDVH